MIEKSKEIVALTAQKMSAALLHLDENLKAYRAGKASPAVLESVLVNYYGTPTALSQVASINVPDAKTMLIQPWEKTLIPAIEKAIMDANLGFTPQSNGEHIRINVPALTEERRMELAKKVRAEGESAKISIRNVRRDGFEQLKKSQKDGMPEDVVKDAEGAIQKEVDNFNKKIEEALASKEKEILTV